MKQLWISARTRFATTVELVGAMWRGPYWWLLPLLVLLLPAALLLILLQAAPLVAPFVYTVF
jgi:hypothetical protein